jgi:four helix bundle protein
LELLAFKHFIMNEKKNIIKDRSFEFAIDIINFYRRFVEKEKEYVLSKQLLRSGTSVGALVREAQNAESKADFIHKLAIAQKECDETIYWLELLKETKYMEGVEVLLIKATELLKMIRSAIITLKNKK